jgi:hypothetical protein
MLRTTAAVGIAATIALAAGSAYAAEGTKGSKGSTGTTSSASSSSSESPTEALPTGGPQVNPDLATHHVEQVKPWEVGASFETHRMIRQEDLEGNAASKVFNVLSLYARYDLTEHDRISVSDYVEERFLADQGETGLRSGDVSFRYTRTQPLPRQFTFSASFGLSAPTSFASQKASLITAPSLVLQLDKRVGKYVALSARATGAVFISKYNTAEGGAPNPKWRLAGTLEGEVTMPFHEPLSIGADVFTGYVWLYQVQSAGGTPYGAVDDTQFPNQPVAQSYGGEIFVRYVLPNLAGVKSDFSLAFADGDPSLGYNSVLHDGVSQFYLFFRQTAEVYGTFSVRY